MPPNPLYSDMGSGVFCVHAFDESFCQPYMHAHMQYEFLFVIQGSILVENSKQTVTSKPPCVIIHCPYTLHRAQTTDQHSGIYERYVINFKENLLSDFSEYIDLNRLKSFGMTQIPLAEQTSKFLKACCEQIIEANSNSNRKRSILILAVIADTLVKCMVQSESVHSASKLMYIHQVMEFIAETLQLNLTLEAIAERFFVSRAKLVADFKAVTGISIKKYATLMKLNMAKIMLQNGHSVSNTAQACGFCNDSHFIVAFKKHTNMTPKEYARQINLGLG